MDEIVPTGVPKRQKGHRELNLSKHPRANSFIKSISNER